MQNLPYFQQELVLSQAPIWHGSWFEETFEIGDGDDEDMLDMFSSKVGGNTAPVRSGQVDISLQSLRWRC